MPAAARIAISPNATVRFFIAVPAGRISVGRPGSFLSVLRAALLSCSVCEAALLTYSYDWRILDSPRRS
jgi:hypothetical protein